MPSHALTGSEATTYNYRHFSPDDYHFEVFEGPNHGQRLRDATVYTLRGEPVPLSSFLKDKPLVLETGSMTCPMYAQSVRPMRELMKKYPELDYLVLYVREAHPGERTPAHQSLEAKLRAAEVSCRRHQDDRPVVVDGIDGEAHKALGSMPNSIFVFAVDGTVLFRSVWNNALKIEPVLRDVTHRTDIAVRDFKPIPPFSFAAIRTLLMGGLIAIWDFAIGLPRLIRNHKRVGNM